MSEAASSATALNTLFACLAPSLFLLGYFTYRGSLGPRRWSVVLAFFATGTLSGPLALTFFNWLELSPFYHDLTAIADVSEVEKFAYTIFGIGPVEEMAKFLVAWLSIKLLGKEADPGTGGIVFAAASALGFATIENWYYMLEVDEVVWHRALTLPFNHVLFSSFWGVGLSLYRLRRDYGGLWLAASLVLSFIYHGLYDFILLSNELPAWLVIPLMATLWVWLVAAIIRLRRRIASTRAGHPEARGPI